MRYEELKVGIKNSYFTDKGYDEDKKRLKTTAEALYKDGDLALLIFVGMVGNDKCCKRGKNVIVYKWLYIVMYVVLIIFMLFFIID